MIGDWIIEGVAAGVRICAAGLVVALFIVVVCMFYAIIAGAADEERRN